MVSLTEEYGLFLPDETRPVGPADTVYGFESGHLQATLVLAGWAAAVLLAAAFVGRAQQRPGTAPGRAAVR